MREMGSLLSKSMRNIYRGCGLNKSDERHIQNKRERAFHGTCEPRPPNAPTAFHRFCQ